MANWKRSLSYPLFTRDGSELKTLYAAREFMIGLPLQQQMRNEWQHAAKLCMEAADGGNIEAATKQVHMALFLARQLDMKRTKVPMP